MQPHSPTTLVHSPALQVKTYLERHRAELLGMLASREAGGMALARRHSRIIDGLLTTFYPAAFGGTDAARSPRGARVMLGAVGGYGRELLGLKSDLDVRLISMDPTQDVQALAEALLYPLWDAGVSIGHQVVSIADAVRGAEHDLPSATALLDLRPIAGDPEIGVQLTQRAYAGPFSDAHLGRFLQRLQDEVRERHRRFSDSSYLLEPDVKSGPGGLRDLDVALWAARARYRSADLAVLVRAGVLLAREAGELQAAAEFFWCLRNHLHHHAGRRSDRLVFDEQENIAAAMGYRSRLGIQPGRADDHAVSQMVEAFMSDYFRHARLVTRMQAQLLTRATPLPATRARPGTEIAPGLCMVADQVALCDPAQLRTEPALCLRLYAEAVARNAGVDPASRDAIVRVLVDPGFGTRLRASAKASALLVMLIGWVENTRFRGGSVVAELHEVGLLGAMIPEFLAIVGRVHHDVYHVYPVDVHCIAAVDHLRALLRGEHASNRACASAIAADVERPEVLLLATLLHDVGKTIGGRGHAQRGAELTREIVQRLGLPRAHAEQAYRLVRQHMQMAFVATRRDLGEARVVVEFAHQLHDRDMLRELYLLTVADVATTAPDALTDWKARMLEDLFLATDELLSTLAASTAARVAQARARVVQLWDEPGREHLLHEFLAGMPERYLLSHAPEEIAAHAHVASAPGTADAPVRAQLVPSRHPGVAELCIVSGHPGLQTAAELLPADDDRGAMGVVAGDRPGLLAAITAAIVASRLEIHAAQIYSRVLADGSTQAVDLFWVRDRSDGVAGVERALPRLQHDLARVVAGEIAPEQLASGPTRSRWSERPSPRVHTEVTIDGHTSAQHTILEVVTKDRPGLLFELAKRMHDMGLSIASAKIHTEGNRVVDVFYVTETDGTRLAPGRRSESVRDQLYAALSLDEMRRSA